MDKDLIKTTIPSLTPLEIKTQDGYMFELAFISYNQKDKTKELYYRMSYDENKAKEEIEKYFAEKQIKKHRE